MKHEASASTQTNRQPWLQSEKLGIVKTTRFCAEGAIMGDMV